MYAFDETRAPKFVGDEKLWLDWEFRFKRKLVQAVRNVKDALEWAEAVGAPATSPGAADAEACDAEPACPLHAIGGPEQAFADAVAVVSAAPVPAGERSLTNGEFYLGVVAGLYSPLSWSMLSEGLEEVVAEGPARGAVPDTHEPPKA